MRADKRKDRRRQVAQPALLVQDSGAIIAPCTMLDVSAGGARLILPSEMDVPSQFVILLSKLHRAAKRHCYVIWTKGNQVGVRFPQPAKRPPDPSGKHPTA